MQFKEFLIGDLFDIIRGKRIIKKNWIKGSIPYVTANKFNRGIDGFIGNPKFTVKNCLTVSFLGDVFYHPYEISAKDGTNILKFKNKDYESVNTYLYLETLIKKITKQYASYSDAYNYRKLKMTKIKLPIKENGDINFEYIENFIQNIKEKVIQKLEEKTEKEINILTEKLNINIEDPIPEYKEPEYVKPFKVGDLFEVTGTKSRNRKDLEFKDSGIEFIGRTKTNNGVQGYLDPGQTKPNELGTISISQVGTVVALYRPKPYYCSQNIIKLSKKEPINEILGLYFVTEINKQLKIYGGYTTPKIVDIKNIILTLPAKEDGTLNCQYMLEMGGVLLLKQWLNVMEKIKEI